MTISVKPSTSLKLLAMTLSHVVKRVFRGKESVLIINKLKKLHLSNSLTDLNLSCGSLLHAGLYQLELSLKRREHVNSPTLRVILLTRIRNPPSSEPTLRSGARVVAFLASKQPNRGPPPHLKPGPTLDGCACAVPPRDVTAPATPAPSTRAAQALLRSYALSPPPRPPEPRRSPAQWLQAPKHQFCVS